jgi:hypothetical protein
VRARHRKNFARWLANPANRKKHNEKNREAMRRRRRELVATRPPDLLLELQADGLSCVQLATLKQSPRVSFIDARGKVSREDMRSASQVIRDWKREEKKRGQDERKRRTP